MTTMLDVTSLTGGYGDLRVLWDVDLAVRPGKITAVLGRNGAGKTSLLDAIAGVLPTVSAGRIEFDGEDVTDQLTAARVRNGLAYVQQNKQIFRQRSVEENLLVGGYVLPGARLRSPSRREALERAYERFPVLRDKRSDAAGGLSGGQQQMLAISQALMPGPKLLLLDEPSAGLSPAITSEVMDLIAQMRDDDQLSILLVEQVVDNALAIADDVIVLESGRVAASGPIEDFTNNEIVRQIYLGNVPVVEG